ncbi:spermatogenesis-associated protein 31E1-like [Lepus europaeus]|uniref:spermatogenesis-associated protein 31E1-like n=1 Tax=Lepus europaeus TaxID=9983 RepID=UPI002B48A524|nr:spermatogenesis-associated protein 31E1-like [Lepus europaeus]
MQGIPRAELPEGNGEIEIRLMEHQLLPPQSAPVPWQRSSCASWSTDVVLLFLFGLGLFFLFLVHSTPSSRPPKRKGTIRKGDEYNPAHAGGHQHHGEPKEDASPVTSSPLPSPALLTQHPPPPDSHPSERPQQVQSDMKSTPAGPAPDSAPPGNSCLASLGTATKGLDRVSGSIAFFSWWWPTAKALLLFTSPHGRCRQEPLSQHPPEASPWGDAARGQAEAGGPPFINPDVQRLLEILISRRAELMLKAEEKTGSLLGQMRPGSLLSSLGALLRSLSHKQPSTTPQLFWRPRHKCTQLQGPQRLSAPQVFGDHLEKKCSQLFWGLPSLHSESLVATAWTPRRSSPALVPSILFNRGSSSSPVQTQASLPLQLSPAKPLSPYPLAPPQPLTQSLPLPLGQIQTQAPLPSSLPNLPNASPPQSVVYKTPCSPSQEKAQSFNPTESQQMEWPLKKRLKQRKALLSFFKNPQEVASQSVPHFPRGFRGCQTGGTASTLPGDSISSDLQEQPEPQNQVKLLADEQDGPPCKFEASQEQTQPQGKSPQVCHCQAMDTRGFSRPSPPSAPAGDPEVQKTGFTCSKRPSSKGAVKGKPAAAQKDLGKEEDDQEFLPWDPQRTSVKVLEEDEEESKCNPVIPQECDCVNYKPKSPDKKHLKKTLNVHLNRTLGQIKEGRIPVRVRRSWLVAASHSLPKSSIPVKPRKPVASKGQTSGVNTSRKLSFLNPLTRFLLETHLKGFDARYGWCLQQMAHESAQVTPSANQAASAPQPTFPSSAASGTGGNIRDDVAHHLENPPDKGPREEKAKQSCHIRDWPLLDPSSEYKDVQRVPTARPPAGPCGFSEARRETRLPPTEPITYSPLGRSRTVQKAERGSPEWRPRAETARSEPQRERRRATLSDFCHSPEEQKISRGFQPKRAEEIRQRLQAKGKPRAWDVTVGASMTTTVQGLDVSLSLQSQGTSRHPQPSRTLVDVSVGQPGLRAQDSHDLEVQVEVDPEKRRPQHIASVLHQDRSPVLLPTTDILASQASWVASQGSPSSTTPASLGLRDRLSNARSNQEQQEARTPKGKAPWTSESKTYSPPDRRGACKRPKPEEQEQRAPKKRVTIACGMSRPAWDREMEDSLGDKSPPLLPEKRQTPPESHIKQRTRPSQQWFSPSQKGSEWEDPLEKGRPASATAWIHGSRLEKMITERRDAEAQAVVTAVAKILIDKLGLRRQPAPSEVHGPKKEPQGLLGRSSCLHRGPSGQEKKRVVIDPAFIKQATPRDLTCSVKSRWISERDTNWVPPSREPVMPASPGQQGLRGTGQRDTLPGGRPASAIAWDQGSRVGRTRTERRDAEAQAVITVVGKIMLDHLGLPRGRGISEIDWYTVERQALLRERSSYRRGPSYTQQSRAGTVTAFGHQATPQGLSCPVKSRWLRGRDSTWVSPPREPACHSSPGQHRPGVTGDSGRPVHCPRNCLLQRGASSPHTQHASQACPSGKSFLSEKRQFLQRKPAQSYVPTSFM